MMIRKLAWFQIVLLFTCAMNDYKFVDANTFNYNSTTLLLTEDFTSNKFNGWSCDRIIDSSGLVCEARYTTFSATDRSDIPKTNIQKSFTVRDELLFCDEATKIIRSAFARIREMADDEKAFKRAMHLATPE